MKKCTYLILAAAVILLCASCSKLGLKKVSLEQKLSEKMSQITDVAELGTVEYTVTKIVKASDDASWYKVGNRKILFDCTAYLKAGIDMSKFDGTKVQVDEEKKSVVVTLPQAELLAFNMPPEKAKLVYENVSTFRSNFTAADRNHLLQLGEKNIRKDVPNFGILKDAEKNASDFFKVMLGQLGFETITVKFE